MKLVELTIKNFKSLGDVTIKPSDLSVIIGPNGSGKTNLANAFAFLRDVYAIGLEAAVQRSGGFENIVSASNKQAVSGVEFELSVLLSKQESDRLFNQFLHLTKAQSTQIRSSAPSTIAVSLSFSIRAKSDSNFSDSYIHHESINFSFTSVEGTSFSILRNEKSINTESSPSFQSSKMALAETLKVYPLHPQQLHITTIFVLQFIFGDVIRFLSNWSVYQLSPNTAKTPGVPTPNPTLSLYGNNLPVLVDHLIRKNNTIWQEILSTMQRVVPTLTDITTGYLYNKTVGLFFHETGFERPWNAEEVSDGTILALAMLCSVNDPRSTLVFIEEPENSLHPWILRELVNNFKHVSATKNIFITTHSPTLIDMFSPNDIWCISKSDRQTKLNRLTDIATELQADWEAGKYKLSDYLDSGLVPQAIPGGSI